MCVLASRSVGLCDCNNFFVSCERREDPALVSRPVVVLSGNDGCVVARSNEVKAMGVPMGEPYFKVRGLLERAGVVVLSGRLSLYNKISSEVMSRIARFSDVTEVYSIDEAFINLAISSVKDPVAYCRELRADVWRHCSIPVSVGISSTKTLAKLASHCAKHKDEGVFWLKRELYSDPGWMAQFEVGDIWGVGRRMAKRLNLYHRILNAADFAAADDLLLKRAFSVNALYTAWELRGYPVHPLSGLATKGFQIPHWDKVLAVTEEAARRLEGVGMVGWDVAVTQDGVCLIEGNSEASYQIIQLPYVEDGIGMKKIFDRFLDE